MQYHYKEIMFEQLIWWGNFMESWFLGANNHDNFYESEKDK